MKVRAMLLQCIFASFCEALHNGRERSRRVRGTVVKAGETYCFLRPFDATEFGTSECLNFYADFRDIKTTHPPKPRDGACDATLAEGQRNLVNRAAKITQGPDKWGSWYHVHAPPNVTIFTLLREPDERLRSASHQVLTFGNNRTCCAQIQSAISRRSLSLASVPSRSSPETAKNTTVIRFTSSDIIWCGSICRQRWKYFVWRGQSNSTGASAAAAWNKAAQDDISRFQKRSGDDLDSPRASKKVRSHVWCLLAHRCPFWFGDVWVTTGALERWWATLPRTYSGCGHCWLATKAVVTEASRPGWDRQQKRSMWR